MMRTNRAEEGSIAGVPGSTACRLAWPPMVKTAFPVGPITGTAPASWENRMTTVPCGVLARKLSGTLREKACDGAPETENGAGRMDDVSDSRDFSGAVSSGIATSRVALDETPDPGAITTEARPTETDAAWARPVAMNTATAMVMLDTSERMTRPRKKNGAIAWPPKHFVDVFSVCKMA